MTSKKMGGLQDKSNEQEAGREKGARQTQRITCKRKGTDEANNNKQEKEVKLRATKRSRKNYTDETINKEEGVKGQTKVEKQEAYKMKAKNRL